jgi:hypothetical protein
MALGAVWISTFLALTHGVFALDVLSEVETRDTTLVIPAVLPGTWKYQGCYTDHEPRTLGASSYKSYDMTIENCISFCGTAEYIYAGVEHSACCELPIPQFSNILHFSNIDDRLWKFYSLRSLSEEIHRL